MKIKVLVKLLSIGLVFAMSLFVTSFSGDLSSEDISTPETYDLLEEVLIDDDWMMFLGASISLNDPIVYQFIPSLQTFLLRLDCAEVALNVYENRLYEQFESAQYNTINKNRKNIVEAILACDAMKSCYTFEQLNRYNKLKGMYTHQSTAPGACDGNAPCEMIYFNHYHETITMFYNNVMTAYRAAETIDDITIADENSYVANILSQYGRSATKISEPSYNYNCHSYAWYSQQPSNPYWLDEPSVLTYDHHCSQISVPRVGDIIVYRNLYNEILHSGIVTGFENGEPIITSKWDVKGLYVHSIENVLPSYYMEELGYTYTFYRYTKNHNLIYTSIDDSYHTALCNKGLCNYAVQSSHVYTLMSGNSTAHTYYCYTCGHTMTENHDYESFTNSLGSGVVCKDCGNMEYRHEHDYIGWDMYSETLHRRMCSECYYMEDEEHTFDPYHGICEKCGYAGPSILKKDKEIYTE